MSTDPRPRVGISRCLLGDEVRYDGGHRLEPTLIDELGVSVEWVPVCPEVEIGMGVPREPIHLAADGRTMRLVGVHTGVEWTDRMQAWAQRRLEELRCLRLSGFVLKARSPSCGLRDVPIRNAGPGQGMFAAALMAAMPDLPVEDEERLRDAEVRARFLAHIRGYRG
jgi:uncharacterized protein YbbK (DUF523 family)